MPRLQELKLQLGGMTAITGKSALRLGLLLLACGTFVLTGGGCRKDQPEPSYNYLRVQLITDLFAALEANDPRAALNAVDRLEVMVQDSPFLALLSHREHTRIIIEEFNRLLYSGQPGLASGHLDKHPEAAHMAPEKVAHAKMLVNAMEALNNYLALMPFADARTGIEALETLPRRHEILLSSEHFNAWKCQQSDKLIQQRELELMAQIESLFVGQQDGNDYQASKQRLKNELSHFLEEYPDTTTAIIEKALKTPEPRQLARIIDDNELAANDVHKILMLMVNLFWQAIPDVNLAAVREASRSSRPASPAGWRAHTILAAAGGSQAEVFDSVRATIENGGNIDAGLLRLVLETAGLEAYQFRARPWRNPIPHASDILDITTQLREAVKQRDQKND